MRPADLREVRPSRDAERELLERYCGALSLAFEAAHIRDDEDAIAEILEAEEVAGKAVVLLGDGRW